MTEPYYQDDRVTLYHGNCLEIREWLTADVLMTDPPYGRNWRQGDLHCGSRPGIVNDHSTEVRDAALSLWGQTKPAVVFGDLMLHPPTGTKLTAVYQKALDAGVRGAIAGVRRDAEAIYLLGRLPSGIGGRSSVFATRNPLVGSPHGIASRAGGHPHAKALDVLEDLIALCPPGIVADPFAGSGSTLVAAKQLGRKAIGVGTGGTLRGDCGPPPLSGCARLRGAGRMTLTPGDVMTTRLTTCPDCGAPLRHTPEMGHWCPDCLWSPE